MSGVMDVRADELRLGDYLDEGAEVQSLSIEPGDEIVCVDPSDGGPLRLFRREQLVRVIRPVKRRAGLTPQSVPGTVVVADVTAVVTREGEIALMVREGDLHVRPIE